MDDFTHITTKELLQSRAMAYRSLQRGGDVKQCEALIDRIETEIQQRQPELYEGHKNEDILI